MFLLQYLILIVFQNRIWIYLILLLLWNIYELSVHPHLFDSDTDSISSMEWRDRPVEVNNSVYELDGRSVHPLDNRFAQPLENTNQRVYNAYNPNYVETSQGWRTELPVNEYTPRNDHWITDYRNLPHINHPSHYPGQPSTLLGEIQSEASIADTYPIGEIEPTRSDLDRNGIYSGNLNSTAVERTTNYRHPDTTYFSRFKNRIKRNVDYVDKKVEKDLTKYHKKHRIEEELHASKLSIKGHGRITHSDLRTLNNSGYTVENSKIIKMLPSKK
uniref:hypothetical protein n=1 Tax=Neopestalotiopsis cubana TaxID=1562163 RepID=UPI00233F7452|nr:hypothetical protein PQ570_mgp20 [Neopestalotiopsis cubana]WBU13055.1 hypothetical protein [Neopestalotiopsis cubana]